MAGRLSVLVLAGLLVLAGSGCADITERVEGMRAGAEELTDRARFCLALARAATAVESGSPDTAAEAAEEVLVHAPPDVREDARLVVDTIREADGEGARALDDPEVRAALDRLQERTRELCDPTS